MSAAKRNYRFRLRSRAVTRQARKTVLLKIHKELLSAFPRVRMRL